MDDDGLLQAALGYAEFGWRVLPVKARGKVPLVRDWPNEATINAEQIRLWWARWPDANIGILCGAASNLVVLDVDGKLGADSLAALMAEHGPWPETPTSSTGGGGSHFLFAHPGGSIKNAVGIMPGVDVRGDRGFIVVSPSEHPSGLPYSWVISPESVAPAPLPACLYALVSGQTKTEQKKQTDAILGGTGEGHVHHHSDKSEGPARTEHPTTPSDLNDRAARADCRGVSECSVSPSTLSSESLRDLPRDPDVEKAIAASLPHGAGTRNRCIFELCRRLKALRVTAGLSAEQLEPVVRAWYERAYQNIRTKSFSETWQDFLTAWDRVILPHGVGLHDALDRAKALLDSRIPKAVQLLGERAVLLAKLCVILGDGGQTFFLGCRDAGRSIGVSHEAAARLLQSFKVLRFLVIVKPGDDRRATRFKLGPTTKEAK